MPGAFKTVAQAREEESIERLCAQEQYSAVESSSKAQQPEAEWSASEEPQATQGITSRGKVD